MGQQCSHHTSDLFQTSNLVWKTCKAVFIVASTAEYPPTTCSRRVANKNNRVHRLLLWERTAQCSGSFSQSFHSQARGQETTKDLTVSRESSFPDSSGFFFPSLTDYCLPKKIYCMLFIKSSQGVCCFIDNKKKSLWRSWTTSQITCTFY